MQVVKGFTGFGGFVILVIGLAMLGVTIWAFTKASLSFNQYTFLGILLGFDLLVIGASIIGIFGVKKQNGFMICVFQIFVMLFFFVFLGIGISAEVLPQAVFEGNCTNSNNELIHTAALSSYMGIAVCSDACQCGLKDSSIDNGNYTVAEKLALKALFNRKDGEPVRFQDCAVAKVLNSTYQDMFNILEGVQTALDCSSWCKGDDWLVYTFTDVNNGRPQATCYDVMKDNLSKYGNIVGIAAFVSAVFLLLVCICGLCVCCAPSNRQQPLASRFIVNDGGYYRTA